MMGSVVEWMTAVDDNCLDFKKVFYTFSHQPHTQGRLLLFGGLDNQVGKNRVGGLGSEGGGSRAVLCLEAGDKQSTTGTSPGTSPA